MTSNPCTVHGCELRAAQPVEIQRPEDIPTFGRIAPKFVCDDHHAMIERGDTWIYEPSRDRILLGLDLEAEQLVAVDTIGLEFETLAFSSEFGNFKRLRIAGRSVPSGEPQGVQLILTSEDENKMVQLAQLLRRDDES